MQRRCLRWACVLAIVATVKAAGSTASATPPNIVFILADDLSWSDLACYGNEVHHTPQIDRLAAEGLRFTQAYAPAPICSASRAALLTGRTPARLHFEFVTKSEPGQQQLDVPLQSPRFTLDLPLEEETIGDALSFAGYVTGFFGKWHVSRHHQRYLGWSPTHGPLQQGFVEGTGVFGSHPYAYRDDRSQREQPVADGEFPEDGLIDEAIDFIRRHQHQPFFLYLSQYFVHDPVHSRCDWLVRRYLGRLPEGAPEVRASYGAMVETLDQLVGRVMEAIDAAGLRDETLVILTSDNGGHPNYTSNAPLRGSKWNLYEGGIRVPLILRWPSRVAAGVTCDATIHGCDLFDTFCEVAGIDAQPGRRDGISLLPIIEGHAATIDRQEPLVWHFPYYHPERGFHDAPQDIGIADFVTSQTRPHSAIRSDRWKLLHFHEDNRTELYDIEADPGEQVNLAASHPDVAGHLRGRLGRYLSQVGARMPSHSKTNTVPQ